MTIHVHIWAGALEEPEEDVNLKHTDTYPNMEQDPNYPNDGYYQFGAELSNGRWLELRIPLDYDLTKLPGGVPL